MIDESSDKKDPGQSGKPLANAPFRNDKDSQLRVKIDARLPLIINAIEGSRVIGDEGMDLRRFSIEARKSGWHGENFYQARVSYVTTPNSENGVRETEFFVKSFANLTPKDVQGLPSVDLEREYALYEIMGGSGVVPRAFKIKGLDDAIILENAGKETSENKLFKLRGNKPERERIEDDIIKVIAKFNAYALHQSPEVHNNEQIRRWVRVKTPTIEDAVRYFKEYLESKELEGDPKVIDGFRNNFGVFEKMYGENNSQLVHGDLRRQNIVGPEEEEWTKENVKIVDLGNMVLSSPFLNLAHFMGSAGGIANSDRWNDTLRQYKYDEANALCGVGGGRISNDEMASAKRRFYSSLMHSCVQGLASVSALRKNNPLHYEVLKSARPALENHDRDMFRYVKAATVYMLKNPNEFRLDAEGQQKVKCVLGAVEKYSTKTSAD